MGKTGVRDQRSGVSESASQRVSPGPETTGAPAIGWMAARGAQGSGAIGDGDGPGLAG